MEESETSFHIIVLIDKDQLKNFPLLKEGKWVPSGIKDYWERLDKPKVRFDQLHVHIAKQKHINSKTKQVSWNVDKTRHDKKSFNKNFNGMETAKNIAKRALGLPPETQLENVENKSSGKLLLESIEYLPANTSIFIFEYNNSKSRRKVL